MASVEIIRDQWVCVDCLFYLANGDAPEDPEALAAIEAGIQAEADAGGHWALDSPRDGEDEEACTDEFSWASCDCCGSTLGGSRHRAAVIYRKEE